MKTNEIKAGDVLFRVDPQKLVIIKASVVEVKDGYGSVDYENHGLHQKVKALVKIALDKFPLEYKGFLFFKTEDEAQRFIKFQIGL